MELFDDTTVAELSRCVLDKSVAESSTAGPYDITVVTVVLNAIDGNRSRRLHQCLDSVQKQKNVRVEHLIVDGASKDGTTEMLRAYKNRNVDIRLLSKPDAGIYDAMNRGIALAHGKYVIFLYSDDYYQDPLHDLTYRQKPNFCSKPSADRGDWSRGRDCYYGNAGTQTYRKTPSYDPTTNTCNVKIETFNCKKTGTLRKWRNRCKLWYPDKPDSVETKTYKMPEWNDKGSKFFKSDCK